MAKLDNPKHEAFALNLAKGMKQGEAYIRAGYQGNPSAASRLATQPLIMDRVVALEKEIMAKMTDVVARNDEEAVQSLADMGITMQWIASAYKNIYDSAIQDASYAAANTAVANIQKLLEMEKTGNTGEEEDKTPLVKLSDVSHMLGEARKLIELGQKEGSAEPEIKDVTPPEASPTQILATRGLIDGSDNEH